MTDHGLDDEPPEQIKSKLGMLGYYNHHNRGKMFTLCLFPTYYTGTTISITFQSYPNFRSSKIEVSEK